MTTTSSFYNYFDKKVNLLKEPEEFFVLSDEKQVQKKIFQTDCQLHLRDIKTFFHREGLTLIRNIGTVVLTPFALIIDISRCIAGSQGVSLKRIVIELPSDLFKAITYLALSTLRISFKIIDGVSTGIGTLTWHGAEFCVRKITGKNGDKTILSDRRTYRNTVYNAIGITCLTAGLAFVPVYGIRIAALPVALGSLYGLLNNQFTTRECPEYYTMGHKYDGKHTRNHAVKTFNPTVKSIVTGCYATTMVTKIAALILVAAGTLPFTSGVVPVHYMVAMIGTPLILGLIGAHFVSRWRKKKAVEFEANIRKLAQLCNYTILEEAPVAIPFVHLRDECDMSQVEQRELWRKISNHRLLMPEVPLRYQKGWEANNTRNTVGYATAGIGTLGVLITTICLRILVF